MNGAERKALTLARDALLAVRLANNWSQQPLSKWQSAANSKASAALQAVGELLEPARAAAPEEPSYGRWHAPHPQNPGAPLCGTVGEDGRPTHRVSVRLATTCKRCLRELAKAQAPARPEPT